ncbi:P-loop containing nucleoside triphosphate hydrolase protein [Pisolithus marmoratus]|nr:P-loop containing nucleoside triphosphate hydrolase protein [Pisolithus marmoratus]
MTMDDAVLSVMVLGEIGVGKSSVVNLITREDIAKVSADTEVCTRFTTRHEVTVESMKVHIWEVSGFNRPKEDLKRNATDFKERLGPILEAKASIDVILLCMRGQKLTVVTERIFKLIDDIFGQSIPIVLVINHLEREEEMEDWWTRNRDKLGASMSRTRHRHVCVTGLQDEEYQEKSRKSREELVAILQSKYPSRGYANVPLESALNDYLKRTGQTSSGQTSRGWLTWIQAWFWGSRA